MILYHGSKYKFNGIPKEIIFTNGSRIGYGFYLTTDPKKAKLYSQDGFIYKYRAGKLDIENKEISPTGRETTFCINYHNSEIEFLERVKV